MPFTTKNWQDLPSHATPLSAAALEDLEARVTAYAETVSGSLTPPVTLTAQSAGILPLTLKGAVSQSADLFKVVNAANQERFRVDATGLVVRHTAPNTFGALSFRVEGDTDDRVVIGSNGITIGGGDSAADTRVFRPQAKFLQVNADEQLTLSSEDVELVKLRDGLTYVRAGAGQFAAVAPAEALASLSEFTASAWRPGSLGVANTRMKLLVAMFPLKVVSMSVTNNAAIAANNTTFIRFQLYRYRGSASPQFSLIAEKTTQADDPGEAMAANTEWTLDGIPFDNFDSSSAGWLLPGDTLQVNVSAFVTGLDDPIVTVRYEPV